MCGVTGYRIETKPKLQINSIIEFLGYFLAAKQRFAFLSAR